MQGNTGNRGGVPYRFSTDTSNSDAPSGYLKYNSATIGSVGVIYIDFSDLLGNDQSAWYETWDDTLFSDRGYVYITSSESSDSNVDVFRVTGQVTRVPAVGFILRTYYIIPVEYVSGSLPSSNEKLSLTFTKSGVQGALSNFQGTQGVQGVQSAQGTQGVQGNQGTISNFQGTQGRQSTQGVQGRQGLQGSISNFQGTQGAQGTQGVQGTQSVQGVQGRQGLQGPLNNFQGTQGNQGVQGVQGLQGIQGLQHTQGTQGTQGVQGTLSNFQGTQGLQGPLNDFQGIQGTQGVQGLQGTQGVQGVQGLQGTQGLQGIQGLQGAQGIQGSAKIDALPDTRNRILYPMLSEVSSGQITTAFTSSSKLVFNPASGSLAVGTNSISDTLTVVGTATATNYYGGGETLVGIVTQLVSGIGINLSSTQTSGKGLVNINSYFPIGKTIFVTQNGNDSNSGLAENNSKRTIRAAAAIAFPGDTIKVFPGVYVEENPIYLSKRVSIEGTELRNCMITPKRLDRDLFYVNNSCHITDLSFVGPDMTDGASVIALQPLSGVATDRFFDAARMIRYNLDFIASETVGYLTSTEYKNPAFVVVDSLGNPTAPSNCSDDIKNVMKAIIHDITRGGNLKCVGAGKSYFNDAGSLLHITGNDPNGYSVKNATIDALKYATDVARAVINNSTWGGKPVGSPIGVTSALYDNITGMTTITTSNHGLSRNDAVKIVGLGFTCPSGPGTVIYPSGSLGYTFNVNSVINANTFEVIVGKSTLPHTYNSGGTIQKYQNFQNEYTQIKDFGMQIDYETGSNKFVGSCSNVVSAIYSCVGVVTTILNQGLSILGSGINTTFPANSGVGTSSILGITSAVYDNISGQTTILSPNFSVKLGDMVEIRDLLFECTSGGSIGTQKYPSGNYEYLFDVTSVNNDGSFVINTGVSTIVHNYVGGGFVVNRTIGVSTASYDNVTGITTITAPGALLKVGDFVKLHDLEFSCSSGAATTTLYPTGNNGYEFRVSEIIEYGTTFVVNTGTSTIPHVYEGGGIIIPPYSPGVGPITQGPYIRNCTNFISKSIGMKVDGFNAEPGDQDDIGVTGTMSVDSYTQYNQGGIGVSITNGAYSQLVSIFTICNDIGIYVNSGGQCDITNSNCSFGNFGLVSDGVGDSTTKSIYRYTGEVVQDTEEETATIVVSGVGKNRPYDGQSLYFGQLYYQVKSINVTNGGSGYNLDFPPDIEISDPEGPNAISAEATATVDESGKITSINLISTGSQYLNPPTVTIGDGSGGASVEVIMYPIYYNIESATLPSSGISTIVLTQNLNNIVGAGTTVYFARLSLEIATSISLEWVGSGIDINTAKPALGGVSIQDNEVDKRNGGEVVYTSTNQSGNFQIGEGVVVNQLTGTISGTAFSQSLLNTVAPLIIALGR
jgi:hypothetical protein